MKGQVIQNFLPATTLALLNNKVDKVSGKQLSTEDFTTEEKNKLAGIEEGATNYQHPATHAPSIIAQDASNRFVTDAQKTAWNGKASTDIATTSANGLMSSTDKTKVDGIDAGANKITLGVSQPTVGWWFKEI